MSKPIVATTSLAGCFGCHMSILDIDERILDLFELVEFNKSPIDDIKTFTKQCDLGIIEGGCCNSENVHVLRDFRKNCKILISLGECAIMGGLPAMRNTVPIQECLEEAYFNSPTTRDANPDKILPNDDEIPMLLDKVRPCHEIVKIDYFLPDCPPRADLIWNALVALVTGKEMDLPSVPELRNPRIGKKCRSKLRLLIKTEWFWTAEENNHNRKFGSSETAYMNKLNIIVFGYGNPGRTDDGLGAALVEEVEKAKYPAVTTDCNYQLNAEDALTIANSDIVIFADASENDIDGIRFSVLAPDPEVAFTTHAMSPGSVLALCHTLYNTKPDAYILEIKGYEWAMAERLSEGARKNLNRAQTLLHTLLANPSRERFAQAAEGFYTAAK